MTQPEVENTILAIFDIRDNTSRIIELLEDADGEDEEDGENA